MPAVDWTRVSAGTFHHFHTSWITHLSEALNDGLLPSDYYALSEQRAGGPIPDVIALHEAGSRPSASGQGGLAIAEAPPRVSVTLRAERSYETMRRTLTIRHASGDEVVALIEIVSPANKDRATAVETFANKAVEAIEQGVHLLLIDLLPPGPFDPEGMHGAIWARLPGAEDFERPADRPLTLSAYAAGAVPTAYVEPLGLGQPLPPMPLFLTAERYIEVPLEETHSAAYRGIPERWRRVIG